MYHVTQKVRCCAWGRPRTGEVRARLAEGGVGERGLPCHEEHLGRSPQQEARAEGVVAPEDELVVPREVRAALDLRHDRREVAHLRLLDHPPLEARSDDAEMA